VVAVAHDREAQRIRREAILRCRGQLSAAATAQQFETTKRAVQTIWTAQYGKRTATKWRCPCGCVAKGPTCAAGHAAPWIADDQQLADELNALHAEGWDDDDELDEQ